eukprot:scaffold190075_cov32-Tisochrysis_lutea.AAC.2
MGPRSKSVHATRQRSGVGWLESGGPTQCLGASRRRTGDAPCARERLQDSHPRREQRHPDDER